MCKIGDIIGVPKAIGDGGNMIGFHYYVVLYDQHGMIRGFAFDKVAAIMSSFHNDEHKKKKLLHKENLHITESDTTISGKEPKEGFIKADQLHYFDKKKDNIFCSWTS